MSSIYNISIKKKNFLLLNEAGSFQTLFCCLDSDEPGGVSAAPSNQPKGTDQSTSLKKMPVTNTLTGTVYCRKSSLSDSLTRSGQQTVSSGNINSSNASSKGVMAEQSTVGSTTSVKSISQDLSPKKTVGDLSSNNRPTLERSNATLQLQSAPAAAPDAKAASKASQAAVYAQQTSDKPGLSAKPPTGSKERPGHRQNMTGERGQHPAKKKSGAPFRSASDKTLGSKNEKKSLIKRGSLSTTSAHLEQRPLGDGAPARPSKNLERRGKLIGDDDEEGEDEIYEDDDYDDDEENDEDGSSDASPSG